MTTFQSIIYSIFGGMTEFLPIGAKAHALLISSLLGWHPPSQSFIAAFSAGCLSALVLFFRHDWASMVSCFLQIILFRKKPMTLDERLPLFIGLTALPTLAASTYFGDALQSIDWTIPLITIIFGSAAIPLGVLDYLNRNTKGMFSWNWIDALCVGITQSLALIPGADPITGVLCAAYFLNYKREAAVKYAYFALLPILAGETRAAWRNFHSADQFLLGDLTWLSFAVTYIVTLLTGLLAIGMFSKQAEQRGPGQYVAYRVLIAVISGMVFLFKDRIF